jgi:hypothetical protein
MQAIICFFTREIDLTRKQQMSTANLPGTKSSCVLTVPPDDELNSNGSFIPSSPSLDVFFRDLPENGISAAKQVKIHSLDGYHHECPPFYRLRTSKNYTAVAVKTFGEFSAALYLPLRDQDLVE